MRLRLTDDVAKALGSYVYVYIDPRDDKPFYIGKGMGGRLFAHLDDRSETEKVARIDELRTLGMEPRIDLLRYDMTDGEAALVEAAAIDLIGTGNLTNVMSGYHSRSYGRISSDELITMLTAKPVTVTERALLITINRLYRSDITPLELYEATRGNWVLGKRREQAELALAVYQGVVREVCRIERWFQSGTQEYKTRDSSGFRVEGRWEFEGHVAADVRDRYVGYSVGKGGQNPVRYMNI